MSLAAALAGLAGGLGLFLLGMSTMTDGLKLAAGPALERILAGATRTRWHALGSGVLMTAVVQSSSAVTVAAIGFVNAGLLGLGGALWVLFGANLGTTMTGWIVAVLGLKFKIEALALPLIGAGALLRLLGGSQRRTALGSALAGFGLLFLGIAMLQESFTGFAGRVTLPSGEGVGAVALQLGVGALLTVLMQSSSASIAIALTAVQSGLLPVQGAAAVVIGANIGTTVTAVLAAIGATSNARRAAAAHVIFNIQTGVVALLLLPWLVGALGAVREALDLPPDPAVRLALFHTLFNVLGVALMWPVAGALTRWLQRRFRSREEDEGVPRHLDDTVLAVPEVAVDALAREADRIGELVRRMLRAVLHGAGAATLARERAVADRLVAAAEGFVERMGRDAMNHVTSGHLARLLRVLRYHESAGEQLAQAAELPPDSAVIDCVAEPHARFGAQAAQLLDRLDASEAPRETPAFVAEEGAMEAVYEALKDALLEAGAVGSVRLAAMEQQLRRLSLLRRALQQAVKARRHARVMAPT